ncbi:MAG: ABC transporter substrate-binding protein [Candidatus Cloacimonetes bacterium]|nr:ABC transporter substrate-binding protein [Candidatus Cloacimonadota bacterium]
MKIFFIPILISGFVFFYFYSSSTKNVHFTIGVTQWISNAEFEKNILGFKNALHSKGFIEGQNLQVIRKNPNGDQAQQNEIIKDFINKPVNLIYSLTTPGTIIASQNTKKIPIVFSIVTYPQAVGLVDSLKNSKNNLTGTRNHVSFAKQFYIFESIYPKLKTIVFAHRFSEPNSIIQFQEAQALLKQRDIKLIDLAALSLKDLKNKLLKLGPVDAIYSACDTLIASGGEELVIDYSLKRKLPNFTCNKGGIKKGALVGNVADFETIGYLSGLKAADILNGAEPDWIETQSMSLDYIGVNLKTAKLIGANIPKDLLYKSKLVVQ